jgi:hypothetical protein
MGRGVRQGNKKESVTVNYYLTNGTYDAALNAIIQRKKNWQRDLWKSDSDKASNEGAGMNLTPEEQAILMSDDPDAARLIVEQNKKTAVRKQIEQKQSRALSTFNQMQNLMSQFKRMNLEERGAEGGKQLQTRIQMAKDNLLKDPHFENKDALENPEPAYVDSDKNVLIPSGHYFSDNSGDWKTAGLYKFVSVDPINRRVVIQKLAEGTPENRSAWQGRYGSGVPSDVGDIKTVDYKDLREHFKEGMKPVHVQHDEFQNHAIENLKQFKHVLMFDPETLSNRKEEILGKLMANAKEKDVIPVLNKKTAKIELVEAGKFRVDPDWLEWSKEGKDVEYWKEKVEKAKTELMKTDDIYLPIDPIRWRNDILNLALDDHGKYLEHRKKYPYTSGRHKSWQPSPPETPFDDLAQEIYGYEWHKRLPTDFIRKGKQVTPEETEGEEE